jgi:hypothetical protein
VSERLHPLRIAPRAFRAATQQIHESRKPTHPGESLICRQVVKERREFCGVHWRVRSVSSKVHLRFNCFVTCGDHLRFYCVRPNVPDNVSSPTKVADEHMKLDVLAKKMAATKDLRIYHPHSHLVSLHEINRVIRSVC